MFYRFSQAQQIVTKLVTTPVACGAVMVPSTMFMGPVVTAYPTFATQQQQQPQTISITPQQQNQQDQHQQQLQSVQQQTQAQLGQQPQQFLQVVIIIIIMKLVINQKKKGFKPFNQPQYRIMYFVLVLGANLDQSLIFQNGLNQLHSQRLYTKI